MRGRVNSKNDFRWPARKIYCEQTLTSHSIRRMDRLFRLFPASISLEGRWGGGIACQDALKHILCRSILGFVPRTVLAGNTPTPASTEAECISQEPLTHAFAQSGGCYVQDERYIAIEHMDVRRDCVSFEHCVIRCTLQT
jgi:hypothetical protein